MPPDYPVSPQPIVFYPSLAPAPHAPPPPFTAQVLRSKATSSAAAGASGSTPTPTIINQFGAPTFVVPTQLQPQPGTTGIYRLPDPSVAVVSTLTLLSFCIVLFIRLLYVCVCVC